MKKLRPVGVCARCQAFTYSPEAIGAECVRNVDGVRCKGVYRAAREDEWAECMSCGGTGRRGHATCLECGGIGWWYLGT